MTSVSAPASLRERKKQRTRIAISQAALQLFAERGFDEVTLIEIAAAADVGPRTLFRYFQDKEELVFADDDSVDAQLRAALTDRPAEESAATAVIEATLSLAALWEDRHAEGRARQAVIAASPALSARERAKHAAHERVLTEGLVLRGVDEPQARLLARTVIGCFAEAIHRWLARDQPKKPDLMTTARETFTELHVHLASVEPRL